MSNQEGPWTVPTCSTEPLHRLLDFDRYQLRYEEDTVPVHVALHDTTTSLRHCPHNEYSLYLHGFYQTIAARFLLTIEKTSDLHQQLVCTSYSTHTQGYWKTLLSLNRSYNDGVLSDYDINVDYVYLMVRGLSCLPVPWFYMTPNHPLLANLTRPPARLSLPMSPDTSKALVVTEINNGTAYEENNKNEGGASGESDEEGRYEDEGGASSSA
ncbi:hypothetical protein LTS08_006593 [Lithohypha guttulata]|uniref:Uncharacterized protein n=2 Tax=Trichomeriaceae TaxID=1233474 RepID=A0ABR0K121_9EURO|nr:hypothetical protein LTR51_000950 [Lithohypha guttulata]KAK5081413.1 hypothetical protein LTR24_008219 [Lithohypha guttulata]KAK5097838.1 hypothetical protein LTS08_006593 [Lithohypha guttulata]KAK5313840.1 hypothetical protein LTR70_007414 [Exophiala xenobiotica]